MKDVGVNTRTPGPDRPRHWLPHLISGRRLWLAALLLGAMQMAGCAGLGAPSDPPRVSLVSLRGVPGEGGAPRFEIRLRVQNPNKQALDIVGIAYSIEVMGRELVTGVTSEVPVIPAYGEEVVTLIADLQLFQLLRLLASVGSEQAEALDYRFKAKIDFAGLVPTQHIEEKGQVNLN